MKGINDKVAEFEDYDDVVEDSYSYSMWLDKVEDIIDYISKTSEAALYGEDENDKA